MVEDYKDYEAGVFSADSIAIVQLLFNAVSSNITFQFYCF